MFRRVRNEKRGEWEEQRRRKRRRRRREGDEEKRPRIGSGAETGARGRSGTAEGGAFGGERRKRAFPASVCLWILFETLIIRASAGNCAILVLYGKVNAAARHASNFNAPSESMVKRRFWRFNDSGGWKIWIPFYKGPSVSRWKIKVV